MSAEEVDQRRHARRKRIESALRVVAIAAVAGVYAAILIGVYILGGAR